MSLRLTAAQRRVLLDALTSPDGGLHSQTPMAGLFTSAQHRDRFYQGSTIRCLVDRGLLRLEDGVIAKCTPAGVKALPLRALPQPDELPDGSPLRALVVEGIRRFRGEAGSDV